MSTDGFKQCHRIHTNLTCKCLACNLEIKFSGFWANLQSSAPYFSREKDALVMQCLRCFKCFQLNSARCSSSTGEESCSAAKRENKWEFVWYNSTAACVEYCGVKTSARCSVANSVAAWVRQLEQRDPAEDKEQIHMWEHQQLNTERLTTGCGWNFQQCSVHDFKTAVMESCPVSLTSCSSSELKRCCSCRSVKNVKSKHAGSAKLWIWQVLLEDNPWKLPQWDGLRQITSLSALNFCSSL